LDAVWRVESRDRGIVVAGLGRDRSIDVPPLERFLGGGELRVPRIEVGLQLFPP
jgi:hypothetical protein